MTVQVIPNLSHFASEGDKRADALRRLAVITDGMSVRVWICMVSGFTLSQTPVAVLKTGVATSRAVRDVPDRGRSQKPISMDKHGDEKVHRSVLKLFINTLQQCCSPLHFVILLLHMTQLPYNVRERLIESLSCSGTSNEMSNLFVSVLKFNWTNGLITLVAMMCICWAKQCVCSRSESCSVNSWTVSVTVLLPPSGALRN